MSKEFHLSREIVRDSLQKLARHIQDEYCPPGWGFCVMLFEFEGEGDNWQWVSSGKREQMIKSLREFADDLENRRAGGPGDDPRSKL